MSNPMDVARVADVPRGDTLAATAQAGSSAPTATPEQTGSQPSEQVGLVDIFSGCLVRFWWFISSQERNFRAPSGAPS